MARLIDADELLKKIEEISRYDDFDVLVVDWDDMIICIDNAPTIDAEPVRHGHWKRKLDTRFGEKLNDIIGCSECNIYFSTIDMIRRSYCPNCGALMKEVNE